jgi:ABC-type transport system substrate-binding protein
MNTKRWLIAIPLGVVALLLQAAFWVPRYETQSVGNPRRLTTFIEAGISDPQILNPVLSADSAATEVQQHVFDKLLYVDEELRPRGKLAERWETTEEAYLAVLPGRALPDGAPATAARVAERVHSALEAGDLAGDLRAVEVVPAEERSTELSLVELDDDQKQPRETRVPVRVELPERVKITLGRVVPDLFERLAPVLGPALLDPAGLEARVHPEGELAPEQLAERLPELLPITEHNPVITFHLRRGVRFHDGEPFDARDVKFTYEAMVDPKNASPRVSSFEPVKAVEIVDDFTVRVVYRRLYSPAIFEWIYHAIIPEHLMNAAALEREMDRRGVTGRAREEFSLRQSETARHPVGTGPFRFVRWQRDELVELERNDDYFEGPAEFEEVTLRTIPDTVTQELEFRAGAVDTYRAEPHQVARYRKDPRYHAISTVTNSYNFIAFNLRRPIFQDLRVRRALAMAIDVDQLIEFVLYGEGQRVSGPYYASTAFYSPQTPLVPYDPEGAKRLLAEAGWLPGPDGILQRDGERLAFKLIANNGNATRRAIMTIAQDAWKKLGVDVVTQAYEWTVFLEEFAYSGDFDALVLTWGGGALDADLFPIWHSSQSGKFQLNLGGYASAEADRLIEQIRVEYDPERTLALAHRLHDLIASDQPYIFLFAARATHVLDRKMVQVERDAAGGERHRPIEPVKGMLKFHFERWRKLASDPVFAEAG